MCVGTDGKAVEIENEEEYGWEQVEEKIDEIQNEYETDNYDAEMETAIEWAEEAFKEIGVKFYLDHSCCNTCGHAEAEDKNYVFYHGQDTERLRKGDRSVHLAFNFDDETKVKVLELIEKQTCDAIRLHWSGKDDTKIFLTFDDDEMAEHIKEIAERDVRMAKMAEAKAKEARRAELVKQLAELDKI
jgi:pterin-4a-carbinolamine dehydratase